MKILMLGSSNERDDWFQGGKRRHEFLRDRMAEEFGEPVEVIAKSTWPDAQLLPVVETWLERYKPDLLYISITSFPFAYESLPLRVGRILGPFGGTVQNSGLRLADSKRWAHNAVFRNARKLGQAVIGGDTHFSCDEIIERYSELIRIATRHEGLAIVVKGPQGIGKTGITAREQRRKEAKRLYVHRALETFCNRLHIDYYGRETPRWKERPIGHLTVGDGVHVNAEGHRVLADDLTEIVSSAWRKHLAETPVR